MSEAVETEAVITADEMLSIMDKAYHSKDIIQPMFSRTQGEDSTYMKNAKPGHFSEIRGGSLRLSMYGEVRGCDLCEEWGHSSKACPRKLLLKFGSCFICGMRHLSQECFWGIGEKLTGPYRRHDWTKVLKLFTSDPRRREHWMLWELVEELNAKGVPGRDNWGDAHREWRSILNQLRDDRCAEYFEITMLRTVEVNSDRMENRTRITLSPASVKGYLDMRRTFTLLPGDLGWKYRELALDDAIRRTQRRSQGFLSKATPICGLNRDFHMNSPNFVLRTCIYRAELQKYVEYMDACVMVKDPDLPDDRITELRHIIDNTDAGVIKRQGWIPVDEIRELYPREFGSIRWAIPGDLSHVWQRCADIMDQERSKEFPDVTVLPEIERAMTKRFSDVL